MASKKDNSEFVQESRASRPGLVREFFSFALENKKWWLLPILAIILILGILVLIGGSGVAHFIYPFF